MIWWPGHPDAMCWRIYITGQQRNGWRIYLDGVCSSSFFNCCFGFLKDIKHTKCWKMLSRTGGTYIFYTPFFLCTFFSLDCLGIFDTGRSTVECLRSKDCLSKHRGRNVAYSIRPAAFLIARREGSISQ